MKETINEVIRCKECAHNQMDALLTGLNKEENLNV